MLSGRPPVGPDVMSSGCSAYRARKALVRPAFCESVTLGWNLKHAIRVTGREAVFFVVVDGVAIISEMKRESKVV